MEVQTKPSQTNPNDIKKPQNDTTSRKITFLKQIITHPIHQFSKVALLMAHNSLPNVQAVTPDGPIRKDFVLTLESYMDKIQPVRFRKSRYIKTFTLSKLNHIAAIIPQPPN